MKRKILALLLSLAMLLSVGGMVEGTLAVGISVDSTRSSVTLGEVDPVPTPTPEATVEPTPEATPETTPDATPAPDTTPAPEDEGEATPTPTVEPEATPTPTVEPTPAPEEKAEHFEGCSDGCTAEGCACPCHAAQKTPEEDFASMTDEELYAYVKQLSTDEEIEAFLKQLPEERLNALVAYAQAQEPVVVPETVVFTDAGPFMPPVTVEHVLRSRYAARPAAEEPAEDNGLELSKTATANNDGSYTIRMEAYTTGKVITSTKTVPVDIVLVLDQSGSMSDDFNGNSRQYAMKQAMNNFITAVAEKYSTEADHRMAIVTFGSNASTLQGWTYVDGTGKTTLQGKINGLPNTITNQATNVAAGMAQAETLMGSGYRYQGKNTTRQKVVIVFTDGVPTTSTDFDTGVANSAITSAKTLKDGGATVYTVGIFNSANPDELYGSSGFDRNSDGSVGSDWSDFSLWMIGDIKKYDIPAGNRFLNYLSSNFANSAEIGITSYKKTFLGIGYRGWEITRNFDRTASGYYLTAYDTTSLNGIFKKISENIQSANIDLGSETVVKDTVSQYFDLPENAGDISVTTYACTSYNDATGAATWSSTGTTLNDAVTLDTENNAVKVTGFDFNANFVSETAKSDGSHGAKIVIEFTVTPKDGFIGGNDVPTNDWEKTAVYDKDGKEVEKFADANTTPTVNVTIKEPNFTVNNKTIYEGNSTAVSGLYTLPDTTGWQYDFVNVTAGANNVTEETVSPTDCTDYTVKVTYAPKTDGAKSKGTPNAMAGVFTELPVTVHVLKPTVTATVNDVQKYYGESYTLGDAANGKITVEWTDKTEGDTDIPAAEGTAPYTNADLSLAYSTKAFTGQSGTVPKRDFDVTVKVMKGNDEIADAVVTTTCSIANSGCTTPATDRKYTVHVKTCQLTITKEGGTDGEPYVFTVKKDGAKYTEATIVGNGSVTIYELPVGTYTIEEDTGWSWRYNADNGNGVTLSKDNVEGRITCTNTLNKPYWLNGFSEVVKNVFNKSSN